MSDDAYTAATFPFHEGDVTADLRAYAGGPLDDMAMMVVQRGPETA